MSLTYAQIMSLVYTAIIVADIVLEQMKIIPAGTGTLILAGLGLHASGLMLPSVAPDKSKPVTTGTSASEPVPIVQTPQSTLQDNWSTGTSTNG
ncbi:MAG TPA: hypothetical protein VFK47_06025 [Ktedonobacteraceae bacterium]|nr:hypothetical protein [Ktedonobacteraceae bacterium]